MRHLGTLISICFLALTIAAPAADAKARFQGGNATVTDGDLRIVERLGFHGGLLVSFIEVGIGGGEGTHYVVSADASATYLCVNKAGMQPAGQVTLAGPVTASADFTALENGRVEGSVPVAPLGPGGFTCPTGQMMVLESVSYTNVRVDDTTHGVSLSIPGTFSLSFPF